ncbi:centrosomal protein CEP57L1 isoform X4 [Meriones unguiculatus]|uniref:centrosomal protein CEP57L1 isoform X4 n=1 Tax=Meriones unguiculatus TaxID=10047 RepID=UPI000B4F1AFB|nr:centrosomal protein CEP57L1 isoform X4 [Meriones unguiculatus]
MLPTRFVCDRNYNSQMPPRRFLWLPANQRFRRPGLTGNDHLTMNSDLAQSVVGSYLNPPKSMYVPSFRQNEAFQNCHPVNSSKTFNSPNNQALVSALKTLQEKIHRLELERTQAEDNLNVLSREAAQYKKALENETEERNLAHQELIKQKKDISIQLSSAQSRCLLLEKQLEYTKRMVLNVEREKNMILEQQTQLQREKEQDQMKLHAKLEKLDVLEKECFRLTRTQQTAEDKIKYLEEKLKEEEHQRKLFQDKAAEQTNCIKREPPQQTDHTSRAQTFEREKMVEPSGLCNLQKPLLASEARSLSKSLRTASLATAETRNSGERISICDNLSELLMAMQDELEQMSMEHKELLKRMRHSRSHVVSEDIEQELEQLVKKMEKKEDQISKLIKHQDSVRKLQRKVQNSRIKESSGIQKGDSHPKGSKSMKKSPRKCWDESNPFLKNSFHSTQVHSLQATLRREDIKWEQ